MFLINGQSYTTDSVATIAAGTANEVTLLRILNAGLHTHAPVLENGRLSIVAEDGNKLPYAKDQAAVLLAAGKTHDAVWTPLATGLYSLYDRMLSLNAPGQGSAGMLAKLSVGATNAPASTVSANNDNYSMVQDGTLVVPTTGIPASSATTLVTPRWRPRSTTPPSHAGTIPPGPAMVASPIRPIRASSGSIHSPMSQATKATSASRRRWASPFNRRSCRQRHWRSRSASTPPRTLP